MLRAANTVEKAKAGKRVPTKKGSSHADVIDRMDFSGVGPSASLLTIQYGAVCSSFMYHSV